VADLLSQCISVAPICFLTKICKYLSQPSWLTSEEVIAMYSTSDEDNAIVSYFFELQETTPEPRKKT